MNKYSKIIYKNQFISLEESLRKQEIWRNKQIRILFINGRPLFGKYIKDKYN